MKTRNKNKLNLIKIKEYGLWLILFLLVIFNVYTTIETATSGAQIVNLEKREQALANEKRLSSEEITKKSSLSSVEQKAQEMGYQKPQNIVYVSQKEVVAKLP